MKNFASSLLRQVNRSHAEVLFTYFQQYGKKNFFRQFQIFKNYQATLCYSVHSSIKMFLDTVDVERGAATGIITAVFYASTRKGYPIDLKVKYNYLRFQGRGRHSGGPARQVSAWTGLGPTRMPTPALKSQIIKFYF